MAEVRAFRAIRYTSAAGPISALAAPPYDVITEEHRQRLAARNPRNIVHAILPQGGDERYRIAAERLESWLREGNLAQERDPSLYLYRQSFQGPDGRPLMRTGFLGLLRLEGAGGSVRHHEETLEKPLEDRLRLIRATRTQLSPIFVLYSDPLGRAARALEAAVARDRPGPRPLSGSIIGRRTTELTSGTATEFNDDEGVRHWVIPVTDELAIGEVRASLAPLPLLIADGHHRYGAALEYRDRMRNAFASDDPDLPENFVLTCFVRAEDLGLIVLPTHRVIPRETATTPKDPRALLASLADRFECESLDVPPDAHGEPVLGALRTEPSKRLVIGARFAGDPRLHLLRLREGDGPFDEHSLGPPLRQLDVAVLHKLVLEPEFGIDDEALKAGGRLMYERDALRAAKKAESGEAQAVFFMRPIPVQSLFDITSHGLKLPQKSTYFAPKLASGLVMNRIGV